MKNAKKEEIKSKFRSARFKLLEAQEIMEEISSDQDSPIDIRDKSKRIANALGIDIDEIHRIKKKLKEH